MRKVNTDFGSYVRELRNNKNMSLKEVAEETGISASYLNRLETGVRQAPSFPILEKIAQCFGVDTLQLCQVAMNNKSGDFDEQAFETVIYNNNFMVGDLEADTQLKESIVSLIKCVLGLQWDTHNKYAEIPLVLAEVDKFKKALN